MLPQAADLGPARSSLRRDWPTSGATAECLCHLQSQISEYRLRNRLALLPDRDTPSAYETLNRHEPVHQGADHPIEVAPALPDKWVLAGMCTDGNRGRLKPSSRCDLRPGTPPGRPHPRKALRCREKSGLP